MARRGNRNIIIGNGADNLLLGLAGNDILTGGAGKDTLDGGINNDALTGGDGDDIYRVDYLGDKVSEGAGINSGTDLVESSVKWTLGANFENLTLLDDFDEKTAENGVGNARDNVIIGNSEEQLPRWRPWRRYRAWRQRRRPLPDQCCRRQDRRDKDPGSGLDDVQSAISIDLLWDNVENVFLFGTGALHVTGNISDNHIQGNFASNNLNGADGDDTLIGAGGNDVLTGGTRPGRVYPDQCRRRGRR